MQYHDELSYWLRLAHDGLMAHQMQADSAVGLAPENWAGYLTTIVTLLIVSSYGIGYLILTLNDGAHGFLEFSLLKPRAVGAGAAFVFLTALPISLAKFIASRGKAVEDESKLEKAVRNTLTYWIYCIMCTFAVLSCYSLFDGLSGAPITWSNSRGFMILLFLGLFSAVFLPGAKRSYRTYPKFCMVLGILFIAVFGVGVYASRGSALIRCIVWVGALFLLTVEFLRDEAGHTDTARRHPLGVVALVLAVISMYAIHVFPFMNAAWGGGLAPTVSVCFSKDSPVDAGERVKATVLEVSDSGFYLVLDGSDKATYIPKPLVTAMEFQVPSRKLNSGTNQGR
jgi:hypothetical protein